MGRIGRITFRKEQWRVLLRVRSAQGDLIVAERFGVRGAARNEREGAAFSPVVRSARRPASRGPTAGDRATNSGLRSEGGAKAGAGVARRKVAAHAAGPWRRGVW